MGVRRMRDLVFVPGQILGVAVIFLPLTDGLIPVRMLVDEPGLNWIAVQQLLLVPVLLGLAMVASTVRQAVAGPLSRAEGTAAYALALLVLLLAAFLAVGWPPPGPVVGPTFLLASVGAIVILAATRKGGLPAHVHAHVALLAAWIVSMGLTVVVIFDEPHGADVGCYMATAYP